MVTIGNHTKLILAGGAALAAPLDPPMMPRMHLDDLLRRYFATDDLSQVPPAALAAGIEHCRVDLGLETDPGKRFALWALLHMLGAAPDLDATFETAVERDAARNFGDLLARAQEVDQTA